MIDIIIAVYNAELSLYKTIDSVLTQSYQDFNIILIDDGSTDKSALICKEYCKKDKRIIYKHKEDEGLASALNLGLKISKNDYIVFLDSDDSLAPGALSVLFNKIIESKSDIIIAGFDAVDTKDHIIFSQIPRDSVMFDEEKYLFLYENSWLTNTWGKIYKRELFNNLSYKLGNAYCDAIMYAECMFIAKKVSSISFSSVKYTIRSDSVSRKPYSDIRFGEFDAHFFLLDFYKKHNYMKTYIKECYFFMNALIPAHYYLIRDSKNKSFKRKFKTYIHKFRSYLSLKLYLRLSYQLFLLSRNKKI